MLNPPILDSSPAREQIRTLGRSNESTCLADMLDGGSIPPENRQGVEHRAAALVEAIRQRQHYGAAINALLNEYSLSSQEGVMLMCLAEALLRVPDTLTADRLISDKLARGDWQAHLGHSHSLFVNASAWGLLLTGKFVELQQSGADSTWQMLRQTAGRAGEPAIRAAMRLAMRIMGTQFVLGRDIEEAMDKSAAWQLRGYRYTYDMLGEAARTGEYAQNYFNGYCSAIEQLGQRAASTGPVEGPGFSIKLSALHPRYELAQFRRLRDELAPRVLELAQLARQHSLGLTIDAEEAHRLDPLLEVFERVFSDRSLRGWEGLGIAVQAYLKNAPAVIDWSHRLAQRCQRKIMLRLVKGAYWDAEIKLAQTLGHEKYPVFTRKASSDLSYIHCARGLLQCRDLLYPQFATHNAHSVAAVLELAGDTQGYEFQRLHGMGEELYEELLEKEKVPVACRIYAPVGVHKDLLAYLVRRLLENGANSSFVHNLADESIPARKLAADPANKLQGLQHLANPGIPLPREIYGGSRAGAAGLDLEDIDSLHRLALDLHRLREQIAAVGVTDATPDALRVTNPANRRQTLGYYLPSDDSEIEECLGRAHAACADWSALPPAHRADLIRRAADLLEMHCHELAGFCMKEAGKTLRDSIADVREAIDFCRYYADQAETLFREQCDNAQARGVFLCISPWNFPVAIFAGQLCAALVVGNTVLAKPAEQTTLTGMRVVQLFHAAGIPPQVLQLLAGPGEPIGARLLPDPRIAGVMFTGSNEVARYIARVLAERGGERVPLVAETGGQNAMVVDSTALLEKVVDDVIASGFNSAGQRCSALRVLLVQEEIAEPLVEMLVGAMDELCIGDPVDLATDIGPIIDEDALQRLHQHVLYMQGNGHLLRQCSAAQDTGEGVFFVPRLYSIDSIDSLREEVFGPIVHLIRYRADELHQLPAIINSTGYGLTFGIHSRIESTIELLSREVNAGNIYVNRNIIGAVVGVQPFGGRGQSGTGPKAGGPHYLKRLVKRAAPSRHFPEPDSVVPGDRQSSSVENWSAVVSRLLQAFARWNLTSMDERIACAATLPDALKTVTASRDTAIEHLADTIRDLIAQSRLYVLPEEMIGPTGESNTLSLEGRGVIACLLSADALLLDALVPAVAALLAGNSVLFMPVPGSLPIAEEARALLLESGYPQETVALLDCANQHAMAGLVREAPIAGVAVAGGGELSLLGSRALAQRGGAILPLLDEDFGPDYLLRFFYEKTISVNTTASGGNAALMSQGELD